MRIRPRPSPFVSGWMYTMYGEHILPVMRTVRLSRSPAEKREALAGESSGVENSMTFPALVSGSGTTFSFRISKHGGTLGSLRWAWVMPACRTSTDVRSFFMLHLARARR
jgi:hypothetical protein